jgi:hypothetical protein
VEIVESFRTAYFAKEQECHGVPIPVVELSTTATFSGTRLDRPDDGSLLTDLCKEHHVPSASATVILKAVDLIINGPKDVVAEPNWGILARKVTLPGYRPHTGVNVSNSHYFSCSILL